MRAFLHRVRALRDDRRGGTAIEYGLILALVVIAIIASISALADTTTGIWNDVAHKVVTSSSGR